MTIAKIVREAVSLAKAANRARAGEGADDSPIVASGSYTATVKPRLNEERRLREFLEKQTASTIYMLMAIMYVGRGDFEVDELPEQYAELSEAFVDARLAAWQMLDTLTLPDFLEAGMAKVKKAGLDVDSLVHG